MTVTRLRAATGQLYGLVVAAVLYLQLSVSIVAEAGVSLLAGLLLLLALVGGWGGLRFLSREQQQLCWGFALYVGLALLSLLNAQDWGAAGWRFEKYYPFLLVAPMLGLLLRLPVRAEETLLALTIGGFSYGGLALYEKLGLGILRVGESSSLNPNIWGHCVSLVATVLFYAVLTLQIKALPRFILAMACLSACVAVFLTGSRGVMLALVGSVLALVFLRQHSHRQFVVTLVLLLAVIVLAVAGMSQSEFWMAHWSRLINETRLFLAGDYQYTSIAARATMLMAAIEVWLQHPLIGTGIGDSSLEFRQLMAAGSIPPVLEGPSSIFHLSYMDALATSGVVGLTGMLLGLYLVPGWYFLRVRRQVVSGDYRYWAATAGLAVLVNNVLFGFTNSWPYLRGLAFVLVLLLVLVVLAQPKQSPQTEV